MWTVRDFTLKLIDTFGNEITSKEYLESLVAGAEALTGHRLHQIRDQSQSKRRKVLNARRLPEKKNALTLT